MPADSQGDRPAEDDQLIDALGRAGQDFRTQTEPLVAGGLARGRRLRRRRTALVAGGVGAVALVGVGGVLATSLAGPARPATKVAAAPPAAPAPTASATPSSAFYSPPPVVAALPEISKEQVLAALKALLPAGQTSHEEGRGTAADGSAPSGMPYAGLVLDDGHGKARITIGLSRVSPSAARNQLACPDKAFIDVDSCTTGKQPDGSTLTVLQGYEFPDKRKTTKRWDATLYGPGDQLIQVSEWNSPSEKDDPVSRPTPPLSPAQLTALVGDKSWGRVLAGVAAARPDSPRVGLVISRDEILAGLSGLLPAGLTGSEGDGQDGYGHLSVNDGKGASLLQINVQDWSRSIAAGDSSVTQIFGNGQTLPDGTKVTRDSNADTGGKGGQGIVMWAVDVLRPDGTRIAVSALNGPSPARSATRTAPALSLDQLQAIATSPVWKLHPAQ